MLDLTGRTCGRWLVLYRAPNIGRRTAWWCECDCGAFRVVLTQSLRNGSSASCGCLKRERMSGVMAVHRACGTREYNSWQNMIQRCTNVNRKEYANYGGRGITVCPEWRLSFEAFYKDMGPRPEGMTLDRADNEGNYEPGNCRWATRSQQNHNQRRRAA